MSLAVRRCRDLVAACALWVGVFCSLAGRAAAEPPAASPGTDEKLACAAAYEAGQEKRAAGQLRAAQEQWRGCLRNVCPDFMRADCTRWSEEVKSAIPSVVFSVRRAGQDLTAVRVLMDGKPLVDSLDGLPVELDPGPHTFRFETSDAEPVEQSVVIQAAQKNRRIAVELLAEPPLGPQPSPQTPPQPAHRRVVPVVLGAVGVAGLAGFATLAAVGRAEEADLSGSCAPRCTTEQVDSVRTKYLVGDVLLGVGVAALAAGAYLFVRWRPETEAKRAAALTEVPGRPQAGWAGTRPRF